MPRPLARGSSRRTRTVPALVVVADLSFPHFQHSLSGLLLTRFGRNRVPEIGEGTKVFDTQTVARTCFFIELQAARNGRKTVPSPLPSVADVDICIEATIILKMSPRQTDGIVQNLICHVC